VRPRRIAVAAKVTPEDAAALDALAARMGVTRSQTAAVLIGAALRDLPQDALQKRLPFPRRVGRPPAGH